MDTATQIQKLWDMKQSGTLTADEFLTMKQRVLSAGGHAAAPVAAAAPKQVVSQQPAVRQLAAAPCLSDDGMDAVLLHLAGKPWEHLRNTELRNTCTNTWMPPTPSLGKGSVVYSTSAHSTANPCGHRAKPGAKRLCCQHSLLPPAQVNQPRDALGLYQHDTKFQ